MDLVRNLTNFLYVFGKWVQWKPLTLANKEQIPTPSEPRCVSGRGCASLRGKKASMKKEGVGGGKEGWRQVSRECQASRCTAERNGTQITWVFVDMMKQVQGQASDRVWQRGQDNAETWWTEDVLRTSMVWRQCVEDDLTTLGVDARTETVGGRSANFKVTLKKKKTNTKWMMVKSRCAQDFDVPCLWSVCEWTTGSATNRSNKTMQSQKRGPTRRLYHQGRMERTPDTHLSKSWCSYWKKEVQTKGNSRAEQ